MRPSGWDIGWAGAWRGFASLFGRAAVRQEQKAGGVSFRGWGGNKHVRGRKRVELLRFGREYGIGVGGL